MAFLPLLFAFSATTSNIRFNPRWDYDGTRVAFTVGKEVRIWSVRTGHLLKVLSGHGDYVKSVRFLPDGKRILTCCGSTGETKPVSEDISIRIFDIDSETVLQRFVGLPTPIVTSQLNSTGNRLIGTSRGDALVWDVAKSTPLFTLGPLRQTVLPPFISAASFDPKGERILALESRKIRILDARTGKEVVAIRDLFHDSRFETAAFSPDGRSIVTTQAEGASGKGTTSSQVVAIYDCASGRIRRRFPKHKEWLTGAQFTPDGRSIVSQDLHGVLLWDVVSGKVRYAYDTRVELCQFGISPDGHRALIQNQYDGVALWSLETGQCLSNWDAPKRGNSGLVGFAPNGRTFLYHDGGKDGIGQSVSVFDSRNGKRIRQVVLDGNVDR